MDNSEFEENIPTWINHFENQAKSGISRRSSFNNRIIVVHDKKQTKNNDKETVDNSKLKEKIPDIVSPVQQVVEQAEEDLRREEEEEEENTTHRKNKDRKYILKRKRTIKGKLSAKKFKDIFSINK
jgi:type IV secretory pathway VirB10-like protein